MEESTGPSAPGVAVLAEPRDQALGELVQSGGFDVRVEVFARELLAHHVGEAALVECGRRCR
ncbi:hypothetical protein OG711_07915 [Streptomyces uncialis]|uniref:hypothetical protein n=1 Tax=Streptomyces uncialis TaxID=1048205 RepID=UPI002E32055D|nr:hypothetical protein [Streptomyces uncialis]